MSYLSILSWHKWRASVQFRYLFIYMNIWWSLQLVFNKLRFWYRLTFLMSQIGFCKFSNFHFPPLCHPTPLYRGRNKCIKSNSIFNIVLRMLFWIFFLCFCSIFLPSWHIVVSVTSSWLAIFHLLMVSTNSNKINFLDNQIVQIQKIFYDEGSPAGLVWNLIEI